MPPDVRAEPDVVDPRGTAPSRWRIHFWALQVAELGVAFLLVTQSVHVGNGGLLVGFAVAIGVLALTTAGPIGVFRICSQRIHVLLLAGLCITAVALAFVPALRPDIQGLLVIGSAVMALVFLATRTSITEGGGRQRRSHRGGSREPVIDATATVVTPEDGQTQNSREATGADPDADTGADSALRRAGRTTGAAAAAGKRAVDEHRPQVEHQVKRGLRGAGRVARKLAGPKSPPPDPSA